MVKGEIKEKIDTFFDPSEPNSGDRFSPLNLLRRQKKICLNESGLDENRVAVWPGVMVVFAGIDMLGFYYGGGKLIERSRCRFKDYYDTFFSHEKIRDESEYIYQARCAMMHTFGLYTKDRKDIEYRFIFDWQKELDFIIKYDSGFKMHKINFYGLNKAFDKAVEKYHSFLLEQLETDPHGKYINNFNDAHHLLGLISDSSLFSEDLDQFTGSNASRIVLPDE